MRRATTTREGRRRNSSSTTITPNVYPVWWTPSWMSPIKQLCLISEAGGTAKKVSAYGTLLDTNSLALHSVKWMHTPPSPPPTFFIRHYSMPWDVNHFWIVARFFFSLLGASQKGVVLLWGRTLLMLRALDDLLQFVRGSRFACVAIFW